MRIINVMVSAFGSYSKTVDFPLGDLGEEGLYLIYGNTGSGKTTLFDAVCFGLFGKASGAYRQPKELRCEYASDQTDTKVVITFEVYGKQYVLSRWYPMDKERTTLKDSKAKLEFITAEGEETIPTMIKKTDVDQFVEDLLKVEYKQFKQIAMIAQGEFQKVLLAPTTERSELFTSMFQTEKYSLIQKEIKKDYDRADGNVKENLGQIESNLERLELFGGESEEDHGMWTALTQKTVLLEQSAHDLSTLVQAQKTALSQVDTRKKEAEVGLKATEEYFNKLHTVEGLLSQKAQAEAKLKAQELVLVEAEKNLEITADYQEKVEKINETLSNIKEMTALCQAVEEEEKKLAEQDLTVKALELDEKRNLTLKETKEKEEKEGKEWLESHEKIGEDILTLSQNVEAEKQAMKSLEELVGNLTSLSGLQTKRTTLEGNYQKEKKGWNDLHENYTTQMGRFLDEQAGILAEQLEEGKPCLVCGSTEHPRPAEKGASTCTSEELNGLREAMEAQEKKVSTVSEQLGDIQNQLSSLEGGIKTLGQTLLQTSDLEEIPVRLAEKRENSSLVEDERKLKELKALEIEKGKKEKALEDILLKKEEISREIQRIVGEKEKEKGIFSEKRRKIDQEKVKLKGQTVAQLAVEQNALETEKTDKENKRKQAEGNVATAKETLAGCTGALQGAVESLASTDASQEMFDKKAEFQEKEQNYKAIIATLDGQEKKMITVVANNEKIHTEVVELMKKRAGFIEEKNWLQPLHDAANGKVKLETFVQSYYFDLVIAEANVVYCRMNNDKYVMLRDEEKDKNAAVGLGVKVYERDTGKIRRARTLSGGESFQASLSLALGFSQAMAQEAQATPIQSLFLDEGFGSLDGDTLQEAIGTLLELAQKGRMVGIISHVEELKNAIPKRILVEKSPSGSKVTFQGIETTS